jgi:Lrp/AsnC family transcriptional regulator, regulator for asnA, asnC and gidA
LKKGVVDDLDIKILNLLKDDSRIGLGVVSSKVKKSRGTILNRVASLQNKGIVKKFTVVLDSEKLGYSQTAVFLIQTDGYLDPIKNVISEFPNVTSSYQITGDFDIVLTAKFRNNSELVVFVNRLQKSNAVKRIVSAVALDVIKEDTWFLSNKAAITQKASM